MELEKSKSSSLDIATYFFFFSSMFWILSLSIFNSIGFISASSSKPCWPCIEMNSITSTSCFRFAPIHVNCKLYTFFFVVSIFPADFSIVKLFWLTEDIIFDLSCFSSERLLIKKYIGKNLLIWVINVGLTKELLL